ncbi:polysaccharide pyruvyl transferase family protein [Jiangella alkaliphila]|uniref:Polysaccharide pyruvyl transferase n=1 Tax=Jiangella alkaliphila TaxID=419479 RepID=A0A1H2K3V9_9ACTN|nr:polysaccharide pyruvyl transferase family protein [Jiangella alkaliphila]SDU63253.1 Polysaccharide pyruvyl transferase [Jiangella alkaliphila]
MLNSVGLANFVDDLPDPGEGVRYLRSLTHVSVRDQESSDKLASLGIAHRLAPDAVHSLRLNRPATRPERPEIALFQVCESVLRRYGIDAVAAALIGCDALRQHPIRVLMTGTWREGGDSVDANRDLVRRVKGLDPAADIEMIMDRRPFDLVDHIQRARVVIGTSLHLRIVASAYDVPRVTLSVFVSDKPTRYARLWDDIMPFDVSLDEMGDAVNAALSLDGSRRVIAQSDELARLSDENLRQVSDQVISAARDRRRSATRL